ASPYISAVSIWLMPRSRPRRSAATAASRSPRSMYQVPCPITDVVWPLRPNGCCFTLDLLSFPATRMPMPIAWTGWVADPGCRGGRDFFQLWQDWYGRGLIRPLRPYARVRKATSTASPRHCEPTGPRKAWPDDRLREAIQKCCRGARLDCFGALRLAMTEND